MLRSETASVPGIMTSDPYPPDRLRFGAARFDSAARAIRHPRSVASRRATVTGTMVIVSPAGTAEEAARAFPGPTPSG